MTVVQDESPDVNESSSSILPSDMTISKKGQASAADIEIAALAAAAASALALTSTAAASNSAAVTSISAASTLATMPTRQKKPSNKRLQIGFKSLH